LFRIHILPNRQAFQLGGFVLPHSFPTNPHQKKSPIDTTCHSPHFNLTQTIQKMRHKYSELDIYEDFINGDLEPSKLNGTNLMTLSKYLTEEADECQDMILGKFRKSGKKIELVEKLRISSGHPLADEYFANEQLQIPQMSSEAIPESIFVQLEAEGLKDTNQVYIKRKDNTFLVGIPFSSEWSEIDFDRLKYCYYNHQLKLIAKKTKARLRTDVFQSEHSESQKLIRDMQRYMLSYLFDVVQLYELKENDLIIRVKPSYTNRDCAALIYLSLVDILNFIFVHFKDYMDESLVVPFYSKVLNQNEFVSTSKTIMKHLEQIRLDKKLRASITDQLEKVLKLNLETRITYAEINYFTSFLRYFSKVLQRLDPDENQADAIIKFLIAFNFNDFQFIDYVVGHYRRQLHQLDTYEEMEMYLYHQQTELKQIGTVSNSVLVSTQANVQEQLMRAIETELCYLERKKQTCPLEIIQDEGKQIRLTANMTVRELTLMFKILNDKKHISSKSTNEMARWLSQSFKNSKSEAFSVQNIRNHTYNVLPETKERLKHICIDILNEVKSI